MFERVWRKGTFLYCWWECKLMESLWKTVWCFHKKLKIELPYDSARASQVVFMVKNLLVNTGDVRDAGSIRE